MLFNITLDTTSEYCCHKNKWPKPSCDVMIESLTLTEAGHMIFDTTPETAYIDLYAIIDPERKLVTAFHIICKKEDGSQEEIGLAVTSLADSVEYFKTLEYQGKEEFSKFIEESCYELHSARMEQTSVLVEAVEDFLEAKDIRIPSSDAEMIDAGDDPAVNSARIYGTDYDELGTDLIDATREGDKQIVRDRLTSLLSWASSYDGDELDFYTEISGFASYDALLDAWGKEAADHAKEYCDEHGLELNAA